MPLVAVTVVVVVVVIAYFRRKVFAVGGGQYLDLALAIIAFFPIHVCTYAHPLIFMYYIRGPLVLGLTERPRLSCLSASLLLAI